MPRKRKVLGRGRRTNTFIQKIPWSDTPPAASRVPAGNHALQKKLQFPAVSHYWGRFCSLLLFSIPRPANPGTFAWLGTVGHVATIRSNLPLLIISSFRRNRLPAICTLPLSARSFTNLLLFLPRLAAKLATVFQPLT